ncbi:hypothetical protein B0H17DRAFT_1130686 [Mycena rosella]|uniref:Uncharacterized protein n=1 Tax=Mycena rosella TaxID=1033263 RepID=A0AAD7DQ43_MYCRO|nr:hypothetical protein B0H17DRAFT_1130686 [Mycena rosella]
MGAAPEVVVAEDNVVGMQWVQWQEEQARFSHYCCQTACCKPGLGCSNAVRVIQVGGRCCLLASTNLFWRLLWGSVHLVERVTQQCLRERARVIKGAGLAGVLQRVSHAMSLPTRKKQRGVARRKREMEAGGKRHKVHRNCTDAISTCGDLVGGNCGVEHANQSTNNGKWNRVFLL